MILVLQVAVVSLLSGAVTRLFRHTFETSTLKSGFDARDGDPRGPLRRGDLEAAALA